MEKLEARYLACLSQYNIFTVINTDVLLQKAGNVCPSTIYLL